MKAFLLSAALAVLPVVAGAATISVTDQETAANAYYATASQTAASATTFIFIVEKDLKNVELELSATGGKTHLTYTVEGGSAVSFTTPYATSINFSTLKAGTLTVVYDFGTTTASAKKINAVSLTATLLGDVAPVPVPAAGLLALAGIASLGAVGARRRKA